MEICGTASFMAVLSEPKCRLSLKVVSQPPMCAPHIPAGMLADESTAWTYLVGTWCGPRPACTCPAGTRWHPDIPATTCPCSASGGRGAKRQPPCISSMSRGRLVCSWRGLSWGQKVSTSHQLLPGWVSITFSSVSLTVRLEPPRELKFVEISSGNSEFWVIFVFIFSYD